MISRRQFIAGSVGAVMAGGTGFAAFKLASGNDEPIAVEGMNVRSGSLSSDRMGRSMGWALANPAEPAIATVYSLHGRGSSHINTFNEIRLHEFAASAGLPLAIAAVDGGDHSYWHRRKDGTNAMAMLAEEFMPMIEDLTMTKKRALFGWSMGGYGALLAASRSPESYRAVVAFSPALWTEPGLSSEGAFDDAEDFSEHDVFASHDVLSTLPVRISCGRDDPFYGATAKFVEELPEAEIDFGPGGHSAEYWRSVSPSALSFIANACR